MSEQITMEIKGLAEKFASAQNDVMKLFDKHTEEIKSLGDSTGSTRESIAKASAQMDAISTELKAAQENVKLIEKKMTEPSFGQTRMIKTPAEIIVESEMYKTNDGKTMRAVELKSLFHRKDLSTIPADGGYDVHPHRVPDLVFDPGQRISHVRDVMNTGITSSNSVEFVRETLFQNNAAAVEEKPEYGKPMSDFTFQLFNSPVSTIAHWVVATRQILSDVPMMLSYVSNRLVYGLKTVEDADILFGNGLNGAMTGIMVTPGLTPQPVPVGGDTNIDTLRRAITAIRLAEYPATAIILNPTDWAAIELTKEVGTLAYIWANVANGNAPRIWGVPVIETTAMPAGQFLVGAFGLGAQLWDREQASVRVSEHHEDYFTHNLVAILAEERLALTVYRPQAFVAGAF